MRRPHATTNLYLVGAGLERERPDSRRRAASMAGTSGIVPPHRSYETTMTSDDRYVETTAITTTSLFLEAGERPRERDARKRH